MAARADLSCQNPDAALEKGLRVVRVVIITVTAFFILAGPFFLRLTVQTCMAPQCPPPGTKVIRDTRIIRKSRASLPAVTGMTISSSIILYGIAAPYKVYRGIGHFIQSASGADESAERNLP